LISIFNFPAVKMNLPFIFPDDIDTTMEAFDSG